MGNNIVACACCIYIVYAAGKQNADGRLRPSAASDEYDEMYASSLHIHSIIWKHYDIHKSRSTQRITLPSQENRATATGGCIENLVKFGRVFF